MQVLPIPELMPFRLTRQMTGALQPHDALALLQTPCTLAMTALRSGKDILEVCNLSSPLICLIAPPLFLTNSRTAWKSDEACWLQYTTQ